MSIKNFYHLIILSCTMERQNLTLLLFVSLKFLKIPPRAADDKLLPAIILSYIYVYIW